MRTLTTICLGLILLACAGCEAAPEQLTVGRLLPDIAVVDLDGTEGDLASLCKDRPTLVAFWGTWCGNCRSEIPELNEIHHRYADSEQLAVLGVSIGEPIGVVGVASRELSIRYPVAIATDSFGLAEQGVERVPKIVLVDADGRVAAIGDKLDDELRGSVERAASGELAEAVAAATAFPGPASSWPGKLSFWLVVLGLGGAFYYSLIVIHCCAHNNLTRWNWLNRGIGEVLSIVNFFPFEDFRALHRLHHGRTNIPGADPHYIRPGEGWLHYVATHYVRLIRFTYTPLYRKTMFARQWKDVDLDSKAARRRDRFAKLIGRTGRVHYPFPFNILASWTGYVTVSTGLSIWVLGPTGPLYLLAFWVAPWAIGQILVADFNYRGHVDLPERKECRPYQGQDTRSYYAGIWKLINTLTFGFYHHREHHIDSTQCLFAPCDPQVRQQQEAQFALAARSAAAPPRDGG
jgi:fatty acid desaturase